MSYEYKLVSAALTEHRTVTSEEATDFANEVAKTLRLKLHPRDSQSYWVLREDCPYVLGWVGHGDYRNGGDGTKMYVVQSRTIRNGKYSDYSPQYFMAMSVNEKSALRNAKKYIRMMSPIELAESRLRDASNAVDQVVSDARTEYSHAKNQVFQVDLSMYGAKVERGTPILNELQHLLTINHEFVDPTFGEKLRDMFAKGEQLETLSNRTVPMWFVRVYERMGAQHFDVTTVDRGQYAYQTQVSENVQRFTADTLPAEIMQKLSVLNILDADEYVDDVGFNAGEGMFYVVR